jgi:hypothetical protein
MLASTAQPGKQEIRTANTATTWLGVDGGGEAVGILVLIMHAGDRFKFPLALFSSSTGT